MTLIPLLLQLLTLAIRLDRRGRRFVESQEADACVFKQRREDHDEASDEKDVNTLEVGDLLR